MSIYRPEDDDLQEREPMKTRKRAPFTLSAVSGDECIMSRSRKGCVVIARVPDPAMRDFIVRACNSHASLVEACKDLLHRLECQLMNVPSFEMSDEDEAGMSAAKAAIAQAEGEV